ncbi:MAG: DUF2812 domain-containing protein, partial [Oscillospiraceae bacterium]|nr:DUF2812 domain-containing protein [Oscillospiraceae bacterium]
RELNFYPYYDSYGMVQHFEEMAEKGWMLESIAEKKLFIRYRKTQPKKVRFGITYFADATVYDAGFTPEQQEYIEYCSRAGWQRIESQGQIQVFCNEDPDAVPLETDPVLTMEIIHDAMKHSYLLGNVTMMLLAVMQLFMRWNNFTNNILDFFSSPLEQNSVFMWVFLFVIQLAEIIRYYHWYRKSMASAKDTGIIRPVKNGRLFNMLSLTATMVVIGYAIAILFGASPLFAVGLLVYVALLTVFSVSVPAMVKHFGKDTETNKKYSTVLIVVVVTVVFFGFKNWSSGLDIKYYPDGKPVYVIENYLEDLDFAVYKDSLPLYIQDFTGEEDDNDGYSYQFIHKKSIFADYKKFMQISLPDYDLPILRYDIVKPKGSYMYNICLESILHEYDRFNKSFEENNKYRYEEVDPSVWQSESAYRLRGGYSSTKTPRYVIAYEDRIIFLLSGIELTQRQQKIIAEKLAGI